MTMKAKMPKRAKINSATKAFPFLRTPFLFFLDPKRYISANANIVNIPPEIAEVFKRETE